jgi:gentisate 1,2-dioxygenase
MTISATRSPDEMRRSWNEAHVKPLWEVSASHTPRTTGSGGNLWPWRTLEPLMLEALKINLPEVAERRVLSFIDPAATGEQFHTTTNLNAAFQVLSPGETARPHRHSMNALRFVLKGNGATTTVDGKACPMFEGDLVLTPGWTWHEHQHGGTEPIIWLDVLDVALHLYLGTDRFQPGPPRDVPAQLDESAFASANVVPDGVPDRGYSPIFRYPLADAVATLRHAPKARDGSRRVRYINPLTGGAVMSLLDCYLVEIEPGTETAAFRTTANSVCAIVRGNGTTHVGEDAFAFEPRDVISLPHGQWIRHRAGSEPALMFVCTDREIYRRLDLLVDEYQTP